MSQVCPLTSAMTGCLNKKPWFSRACSIVIPAEIWIDFVSSMPGNHLSNCKIATSLSMLHSSSGVILAGWLDATARQN